MCCNRVSERFSVPRSRDLDDIDPNQKPVLGSDGFRNDSVESGRRAERGTMIIGVLHGLFHTFIIVWVPSMLQSRRTKYLGTSDAV